MKQDIGTLTGLRGVAALFVLLYHFCEKDPFVQGQIPWLVQKGYLAVDLFFVLSGALMALTYAEFFRDTFDWAHYRIYIVKRIARIYPLYLFMLLFFLIQYLASYHVGGQHIDYGVADFFADLFMIQAWGFGFKGVEPAAWAVSTEFFAYLVFPALLFVTIFARPVIAGATIIVGVALLVLVTIYFPGNHGPLDTTAESVGALLRCLGGFILGVMSFRLSKIEVVRRFLAPSAAILVLAAGLAVAGFLQADDLVLYAFFPFIVMTLSYEEKLPRMIFANRFIHHLGVVSYAIYLVHPFFVGMKTHIDMQTETQLAHAITFVSLLLATWGAAALLHRRIDLPGRRFITRRFFPSAGQK